MGRTAPLKSTNLLGSFVSLTEFGINWQIFMLDSVSLIDLMETRLPTNVNVTWSHIEYGNFVLNC